MSIERIKLLKAYGAEVYLTPRELNMGGSGAKAKELAEAIPTSFTPQQGMNPSKADTMNTLNAQTPPHSSITSKAASPATAASAMRHVGTTALT